MTIVAERLGAASFLADHGVRYAYAAGAMYKGIASKELVIRMAASRLLAYLGTGGLRPERIAADIQAIRAQVSANAAFGMNLLCDPLDDRLEQALVSLYLREGIRRVEAAAYTQVSPALVRYRLHDLHRDDDGRIQVPNKVLAKVSRPEVALAFLSPPPERMLRELVAAGQISPAAAELAAQLPMADDICVEADSGGHTDQGVALAIVPSIRRLRDETLASRRYAIPVRIGAAGGLGAPEALAAVFMLGVDFVMTGSVNQCTVEAGMSDAVKDMLQTIDVQDTAIAPAGDMFEQGVKVRVLRKGVLFPARANKLYELYKQSPGWEAIDAKTREQIESKYFKRTFEAVYAETRDYLARERPDELVRAERDPKARMAQVFKWYFIHSARLARAGSTDQRVDYQVHCGPALGAFNRFVHGTPLEDWRRRHVDDIAERLMQGAAHVLGARMQQWSAPAAVQPMDEIGTA